MCDYGLFCFRKTTYEVVLSGNQKELIANLCTKHFPLVKKTNVYKSHKRKEGRHGKLS